MSTRKIAGRPALSAKISSKDFRAWYWMKDELIVFARALGLPTHGYKPALAKRIERRLCGLADLSEQPPARSKGRDSDRPLTRKTPVVSYYSDDATRAFFKREIGPEFHFTYHVNQFRLGRKDLTYGDLIDEWIAERDRRQDPKYEAKLAKHGKWNRFVRDFFKDQTNKGKSIADAASAWRKVKAGKGGHTYAPRRK